MQILLRRLPALLVGSILAIAVTGAAAARVSAQTIFLGNLNGTPGADIGGTVPTGGTAWGSTGGEIVFAPGGGVQDVGPNSRATHALSSSALLAPFALSSLASGNVLHLHVLMANLAPSPASNLFESTRVDLVTNNPAIGDVTLGELTFPGSPATSNGGDWGANTYQGSPITSPLTTGASGVVALDLYLDPNDAFRDGAQRNAIVAINGGCPIRGTIAGLDLGTAITGVLLVRNVDDEVSFKDLVLEAIPAPQYTTVLFQDHFIGTPGADLAGSQPYGGTPWGSSSGEFRFAPGGGVRDSGPNSRSSQAFSSSNVVNLFAMNALAADEVLHLQVTMTNIAADPATNVFESTRVDLVTANMVINDITLGELSFVGAPANSNNGFWGANNTSGTGPLTSGVTTAQPGPYVLDLYLDPRDALNDGPDLNAVVTVNGGFPIRGRIDGVDVSNVITGVMLVRNVDDEVEFDDLTLEKMPVCAATQNLFTSGCAQVPAGLVSWWKLDGNASDVTNANPGAAVGGGGFYAPAEVRQGFHPDTATIIDVPDAPSLNPANLTIDCWARLDSLPVGGFVIAWKGDPSGLAYTSPYELAVYGADQAPHAGEALAVLGNATAFQELDAGIPFPVGSWVHLAMTADGSTFRLYQDGVLVRSALQTVTPGASGFPLQIGGILGGSPRNSFPGTIDELELHALPASSAQIAAIHAAGPLGKCPYEAAGVEPLRNSDFALIATPNPSQAGIRFAFTLPAQAAVELEVFTVAGRRVASVAGGNAPAGPGVLTWDGRNAAGAKVAPGVYFARLRAAGLIRVARLVITQ